MFAFRGVFCLCVCLVLMICWKKGVFVVVCWCLCVFVLSCWCERVCVGFVVAVIIAVCLHMCACTLC